VLDELLRSNVIACWARKVWDTATSCRCFYRDGGAYGRV
jgi:hypothetical protein